LPYPGYDKDSFCDNHVGIYSSGKLSVTFSPPAGSNTIRIYHTDQVFYLSKNEFENLKSKGIKKAVLILTEGKKQIKVVTVENIATLVKENGALFKGVQLAGVENKNSATKSTKTSNSTTDKSNKSSNKTQKNNNESGKHSSSKKHNNDDSWNGGFLIIAILIIIIIIVIIWVVVKCFYGGDSYNNYQNTDIGLR
jgi:ATP-dependent Zn protease